MSSDKVSFAIQDTYSFVLILQRTARRLVHLGDQLKISDDALESGLVDTAPLSEVSKLLASNANLLVQASDDFLGRLKKLLAAEQQANKSWGDSVAEFLQRHPRLAQGLPFVTQKQVAGFADGAEDLANLGALLVRLTPRRTVRDIRDGKTPALIEIGVGLDSAVTHPLDTAKAMAGLDYLKQHDFERWTGKLGFEGLTFVATGGASKAATSLKVLAADRAAMRVLIDRANLKVSQLQGDIAFWKYKSSSNSSSTLPNAKVTYTGWSPSTSVGAHLSKLDSDLAAAQKYLQRLQPTLTTATIDRVEQLLAVGKPIAGILGFSLPTSWRELPLALVSVSSAGSASNRDRSEVNS